MYNNRRHGPGLLILAYHILTSGGIDRIPPVTLATVGLQVVIFLRIWKFSWNTLDTCISFYYVWYGQEWKRLILGPLEHIDDWHLYFNMISFILKGQALERRFGSLKFLFMLPIFTFLSSLISVLLHYIAAQLYDRSYEYQCSVGFSAVIFTLKVLTSYYNQSSEQNIPGIPVSITSVAVWTEVFLIQLFVPKASILGHSAGVLVGLAYIKGPLKRMIDTSFSLFLQIFFPYQRIPYAAQNQFRYNGYYPPGSRSSAAPLYRYNDFIPEGMSEEEQLREATEASLMENYRHSYDGGGGGGGGNDDDDDDDD